MRGSSSPAVLFVLPVAPSRSPAVQASWIASASMARALGRRLGGTDVLTPRGLLRPDEMMSLTLQRTAEPSAARDVVRRLPMHVRAALGDLQAINLNRKMRALSREVAGRRYRLVVQRHHRFQDCGLAVAKGAGIPSVLLLDAMEVREEAAWGIRRPGWGRVVERIGELRIIRRADLVASVSAEIDEQLPEGSFADRRVIVPSGVDLSLFAPGPPDRGLRVQHALDGRFAVGWIGGFWPFHGLEAVAEIARGLQARVPEAVLCLVGTGPLRDDIAKRVRGLEAHVRLLDPVPHDRVPQWLRTFDACFLLAGAGFRSSSLKLYEYLACGRPVVAAAAGQVKEVLTHGSNGFLVPREDPIAVVGAIERLARDPALRRRLGEEARRTVEGSASWDDRAESIWSALEERGFSLERSQGKAVAGR